MQIAQFADFSGGSPRRTLSYVKPHLWRLHPFDRWYCRFGLGYASDMDPLKAQRLAEWQNKIGEMPPTARARYANFDPNALIGKAG